MKKLLLSLLLTLSFSTFANTTTLSKAHFSQTGLANSIVNTKSTSGFRRCTNNCNANAVNDCIARGGNVAVCEGTAVEVCYEKCSLRFNGGYF